MVTSKQQVAMNYRLNIFGYLSAEDSGLPGNYGSLDQIEALRYLNQIKINI